MDQPDASRPTPLQVLVDRGVIAREEAALGARNGALDLDLARLGLATEAAMRDAWADAYGLDVLEHAEPAIELCAMANREFLRARRILPVAGESHRAVRLASVAPEDIDAVRALATALERAPEVVLITNTEFERAFAVLEAAGRAEKSDARGVGLTDRDAATLTDLASEEPVVRLVSRLISEAARARASDLHIEPQTRGAEVRFRIDGAMRVAEHLTAEDGLAAISRIKILAGLDIAERRRAQDGRFTFAVAGRAIDLRVSTVGAEAGESLVLRLLDDTVLTDDLSALGFSETARETANRLLQSQSGVVLVTGPTGSGKTTTLYAFLQRLAKRQLKILTVEDPIEYRIKGAVQSQVNAAAGVSFASALRSFLRHDPDVMMVGEIRDLETAKTAAQAALTGHLVLSTAHTNDAPSAITRLRDLGLEPFLIAETLKGVFAQRLVKRNCETCSGAGCETCGGVGTRGRIAVVEAIKIDDALRKAIRDGAGEDALRALASGPTLADDAREKLARGVTNDAEANRILGASH